MTKEEYRSNYLSSPWWRQRRKQYLKVHRFCEATERGEICGVSRMESIHHYGIDLDVHHLNYRHMWGELDDDIQAICRRHHDIEHYGSSLLPYISASIEWDDDINSTFLGMFDEAAEHYKHMYSFDAGESAAAFSANSVLKFCEGLAESRGYADFKKELKLIRDKYVSMHVNPNIFGSELQTSPEVAKLALQIKNEFEEGFPSLYFMPTEYLGNNTFICRLLGGSNIETERMEEWAGEKGETVIRLNEDIEKYEIGRLYPLLEDTDIYSLNWQPSSSLAEFRQKCQISNDLR